MTDARQDKVKKLFESRAKAETELQRMQEKVQDAVENKDRRVRIERLVTSCQQKQATKQNVNFKDIQTIENIQSATKGLANCQAT